MAQMAVEQNELFNIFHRLDWMNEWLKTGKGELTAPVFWSLIDIRIPLDLNKYNNTIRRATRGPGNAGDGNGWGLIQQKLAPHLYEMVNAQPNIMDWRATEAVCNHYLQYNGENYPDNASRNSDYLFNKYKESHNVLVGKYKTILDYAFGRPEFMKFLESSDVELANIEAQNPVTKEVRHVRNVVRSFPNYWYDSTADPKPTYLYHYKKMNFLLKTIADCNYLAFDLLLDKLDAVKHKNLLFGYITLNSNNDQKKSNIRSYFHNMNLDYNDLTNTFGAWEYQGRSEVHVQHPAPAESFSDESSPFNPENIDLYANKRKNIVIDKKGDARKLFIDVAERSGIRQRHSNNYGYTTLRPNIRSNILAGKWKYDWLFQHSYASEGDSKRAHKVGYIQPGLDKKYILTFILQHAYETNDRRLYEDYRRFRHIYGTDYCGKKPDTTATASPYFEAHFYGGGGDKGEWLKIRTFEFVEEQLAQTDSHLNISACQRWLTEYNKKLINVGKKFLKKLDFPKDVVIKSNHTFFERVKVPTIRDATKFFLASVDKKALEKGTTGSFQTGHSHATSAFMVENQDWIVPAKRAWLWWTKNDITLKDRPSDLTTARNIGIHEEYIAIVEQKKQGFSGFWGIVNLFGSNYNLNNVSRYTQQQLETMVNILTFKQTLNKVFEDEYKKQGAVQNLLILDTVLEGMNLEEEEEEEEEEKKKRKLSEEEEEEMKKRRREIGYLKKICDNKNILKKIGDLTEGGKRRKKTKSKYNKRMTKRTRRKRGGTIITAPNGLVVNKKYKVRCNCDDASEQLKNGIEATYQGQAEGHMGLQYHSFTVKFNDNDNELFPIYYGDRTLGSYEPDSVTSTENVTAHFYTWVNGYTELVIESVETGGRRRRRKRRKRKTKKKRYKRRKYTKKKRRKRRKLN